MDLKILLAIGVAALVALLILCPDPDEPGPLAPCREDVQIGEGAVAAAIELRCSQELEADAEVVLPRVHVHGAATAALIGELSACAELEDDASSVASRLLVSDAATVAPTFLSAPGEIPVAMPPRILVEWAATVTPTGPVRAPVDVPVDTAARLLIENAETVWVESLSSIPSD
jgi:hypothetical protein